MTDEAVVVKNLTKRFDEVQAVKGISFDIHRGELFGLLGPNGAGKTTTINMLTGLARPESGVFRICGVDCTRKTRSAQHLMGVVPDESNLYPELTGFENLCFCAALYGMRREERQERAWSLLKDFGLKEAAERRFGGYSKGMKRKLTIAAGIIHKPEILFLDEPTTGIDVASARQLRQLISDLHDSGTTILLTTHYIEEAERLCDRIAFIVSGRIVRIDSVENLVQPLQSSHVLEISCEETLPGELQQALAASFPQLVVLPPGHGTVRVESNGPIRVAPLVRFLEEGGYTVSEARRVRTSLEDVFVRVTGIETKQMRAEKNMRSGRP
ncbi:ABC transporter ATP-binding protein [Oceanidesulfovibrio marinus]|uniref:ABC transporter ATP-binding protein n=1 Tax=Oceanidesulfovibrio marinus TaxID=370038 RepID=A0A6P1ZH68_9BACT|nr:ABC transporter ATP-binding protein [Oceanidesulfovibrio marinus]QJT07587.1 ABC transporter ATP-binding protein [Oceanidesulfovibrio marinus]TVM34499.1 ABC transporter ATP-binding protein [Oceanidesulfovibrio marinus]